MWCRDVLQDGQGSGIQLDSSLLGSANHQDRDLGSRALKKTQEALLGQHSDSHGPKVAESERFAHADGLAETVADLRGWI